MPNDPFLDHLVHQADLAGYRLGLVPFELVGDDDVDYGLTATQHPSLISTGIDIASEVVEGLDARGVDLTTYPLGRAARVIAEEITDGIDFFDAMAGAVAARTMACVDMFEQAEGFNVLDTSLMVLIEVLEERFGYTSSYATQVVTDCLTLIKQLDREEG